MSEQLQRCPTCGSRVTVHTDDEGTCSYEAWDDAATTAVLAENELLRRSREQRFVEILLRNITMLRDFEADALESGEVPKDVLNRTLDHVEGFVKGTRAMIVPPDMVPKEELRHRRGSVSESAAQDQPPRGWVVRLGSYLRIFGGRGDAGQPEHRAYIDRLTELAKEREGEHGGYESRTLY